MKPRVIGITGAPYCGSTLLDRCLGLLPGVVALGETRWILEAGIGPWTHLGACGAHGSACPVFTREVLADLRAGGYAHWWERLAGVTGAAVLVSADKSPVYWRRLGLPDLLVVPYRTPASMLASFAVAGRWGTAPDRGATEIASVWSWVRGSGLPFVAFDTDALADGAEGALCGLADHSGLAWDAAALRPWDATGCVFGGNSARLRGFDGGFRRGPVTVDEPAEAVRVVADALADLLAGAPL